MKLKKLIGIGALALILVNSVAKAQDSKFSIKLPYNLTEKNILAEPTAEYKLPGKINGFTFIDLFSNEYYGQTDLTKKLGSVNVRSRIINNNELYTKSGIGLNKDLELFDEKVYLSVSILPLWFDKKGYLNRQTMDYFFNVNLGKNWSLNGFGEWELQNKKVNWVYGELDIGKDFNNLRLSYSPAIVKNEIKGINYQHRLALTYKFN